ncbi:hypothetical protein [Acetobacterium malicum]|uniref:hypothetical protein n=1 Tax=Acetobacterium malicum TaxID=52692 RepID=UPI00041D0768|nr:hypothetical protein [Acetobacterium dehalogenans]
MAIHDVDYIFRNSRQAKQDIFKRTFYLFNHEAYLDPENEDEIAVDNQNDYDNLEEEYQRYCKLCDKNLGEVLKIIKSPLIIYTKTRMHKEIPILISAMFFSIMTLVKDENVTPKELEKILTCPIDDRSSYNFNENLFLQGITESLEIMFGCSEYNGKFSRYDHLMKISNGNGSTRKKTREKYTVCRSIPGILNDSNVGLVELSTVEIKKTIRNFEKLYNSWITKQYNNKRAAKKKVLEVENKLAMAKISNFTKISVLKEIRSLIFEAYGLNSNRENELEYIFPLDFIEGSLGKYNQFTDLDELRSSYAIILNGSHVPSNILDLINEQDKNEKERIRMLKRNIEQLSFLKKNKNEDSIEQSDKIAIYKEINDKICSQYGKILKKRQEMLETRINGVLSRNMIIIPRNENPNDQLAS